MIEGYPIDRGLLDDGWVTITQLAGERFDLVEGYFKQMAKDYPGLDRRGQGAFFIGGVSYYLAAALGNLLMTQGAVPALDSDDIGVQVQGADVRYRLAEGIADGTRDAGEVCAACLGPLVLRVAAETRLGLAAQWRLLADGVASAFQEVGGQLGCADEARERALEIVQGGGPLSNLQTGFHRLEIGGDEKFFLKRGGCCRWFTALRGDYCATCVMRNPEEQVRELMKSVGAA